MVAETATQFEALEAQAARITGAFVEAGYERVAPSIIQPAVVCLAVVG
jgi:ATP phosphoribosyltransferase regulatory subunit